MKSTTFVKMHLLTVLAATALLAAVYFLFIFLIGPENAIVTAGLLSAALYTCSGIYVLKRKRRIVVPKYPAEKNCAKFMRVLPWLEFVVAACAAAYVAHIYNFI